MASNKPLAGTTTLILRPESRARGLAELIESAGGFSLVSPIISRAAIEDTDRALLDDSVTRLPSFEWVAITSVNAVAEVVGSIQRVYPDRSVSEVAALTRWATVGPATTAALAKYGIATEFEASENSAVGMLAEWPDPAASSRSRVLLPVGDLASTQLENGLSERGFTCERVTVYRTISHPASDIALRAWHDGDIDAVILTSGSIVREFAKQFDAVAVLSEPLPVRPLIIAIGQPTTRAAQACGLSVDVVAKNATNHGLFDALVRAMDLATKEY